MSFTDILYGKKKKQAADKVSGIVKAGMAKGATELNAALDTPSEQIVQARAEQTKSGMLAQAMDARRNAQRVMAQTGMGNSSIGLANNRAIDRETGMGIADLNASLPGMIRDQKISDANARINQGGLGTAGAVNWNTTTNRGGGFLDFAGAIAPLVGAGVGTYMGAKNTQAQTNYIKSQTPGKR